MQARIDELHDLATASYQKRPAIRAFSPYSFFLVTTS